MFHKYGTLCSALSLLTGWLLIGLSQGEYWQVRDGSSGYVEIFYRSEWRPLVTKDLDAEDQKVICRNMGFSKPEVLDVYYFPYTHKPGQASPATVQLSCRGNETTIGQCPVLDVKTGIRTYEQAIHLTCTRESWQMRGGRTGRVEIFYRSKWRPLVTKDLSTEDRKVMCRTMGFSNPEVSDVYYIPYTPPPGQTSPTTLLLGCHGNETTISQCPVLNVTIGIRASSQAIDLTCTRPRPWRLRKGPNGYLELKHGDLWRPLVTKDLKPRDERVLCRQLKFSSVTDVHVDYFPYTPQQSEPSPASVRLTCRGNERTIKLCSGYDVKIGVGADDQVIDVDCVSDDEDEDEDTDSNNTTYIIIGVVATVIVFVLGLLKFTNGELAAWLCVCCCFD